MQDEFEISMMGKLNCFLGLQIKQMENGIFFNQSEYIKEMLKKFGLENSKPTKTPMSTDIKLTKNDEADPADCTKYQGEITQQLIQMDLKCTKVYLLRIHRSRKMDEDLRESYCTLEKRLFHEGRFVTPSFIEASNMLLSFQAVGLEPFLTLDEPNRFVVKFCQSLKVKRDEDEHPYIEFKLGQFTFKYLVNACTAYMLYYITIKRKFNFTTMILYRMEDVKKNNNATMTFVILLTRLYNHILRTNPQAIFLLNRFTFHERVMNPLDILRNPTKGKGKKVASPWASSSSSSLFDGNEAPSFLDFYEELFDNEDLTDAQREKQGMFKCLNRYFGTITNEEHQNEITPSPPPRNKSLLPPQAPSKSISSKSTHYTSSSSPKLPLLALSQIDNWPSGPSNPSPPPHLTRPPPEFPHPRPGFEQLTPTQPLFVNINNNTPTSTTMHLYLKTFNIHHQILEIKIFPTLQTSWDFFIQMTRRTSITCFINVVAPQGMKSKCSETVSTTCSHTFNATSALHQTHHTSCISRMKISPHPSDYMGK
nr:retrovirus-related Pol polyprotein from transposon TNT 1-94 [Tanacetum cinerariifolium]